MAETEQLAVASLKARRKVLGREHEDTLCAMAMAAHAHSLGERWGEAEKLEKQVLKAFKTKLRVKHLATLVSIANLASTYSDQGR